MSSGYPMTGTVVVAVNKLYSIYAHFQSADQNTSKTADKKFGFPQAESVHRDENES